MKYAAALLVLLAFSAHAERATTQPGELSTPKKALKYFDRVGADANVDRATVFYAANTEDEKKVAKAFAAVDLAIGRLRKKVATRWDREAGDKIVHAMRDVTADDIDAAKEEIDGDKATITGKYFGEPLSMVKVNNAWKVSIAKVLSRPGATAEDLIDVCADVVEAVEKTEQEFSADKYANPSLLERAVMRRMKEILGDE